MTSGRKFLGLLILRFTNVFFPVPHAFISLSAGKHSDKPMYANPVLPDTRILAFNSMRR